MKLCKTCCKEKEGCEYHKRSASYDGLSSKCKKCQSQYDKNRANLPHRVKARADYQKTEAGIRSSSEAKKRWAKSNKDKIYLITKRYRKENPRKYSAHGKVAYEVKMGNLVPEPCEVCGSVVAISAHHDDYAKPLNVRWLCSKHHKEWHRENGEGLNAN